MNFLIIYLGGFLPVFTCCSGLYMSGVNDRKQIIAIEKIENFVIYLTLFLPTWKYGHAEHSFGHT